MAQGQYPWGATPWSAAPNTVPFTGFDGAAESEAALEMQPLPLDWQGTAPWGAPQWGAPGNVLLFAGFTGDGDLQALVKVLSLPPITVDRRVTYARVQVSRA